MISYKQKLNTVDLQDFFNSLEEKKEVLPLPVKVIDCLGRINNEPLSKVFNPDSEVFR